MQSSMTQTNRSPEFPGQFKVPVFRDLWKHIGKDMPRKGRQTGGDPLALSEKLQTALHALYSHYEETHQRWEQDGIESPPVFIAVCNNTSTPLM